MAKRLTLSLALILMLSTGAVYAETYGAVLTGAAEVPPVNTPGFGYATVILDAAHTSVNVDLVVTGLTSPIILAHIHGEGDRTQAVGVKVELNGGTNIVNGRMNRAFAIDKPIGDAIAANPHLYYLNVHTSANGGGEVRGQLTPLDSSLVLAADMRGANERPNPVVTNATGAAVVTIAGTNITWDVASTGMTPTRAHIHTGTVDAAGSILVTFAEGASAFTNGRTRGTIAVTEAIANDIRANPAGFYVNVHSAAFPGGEIRGQLAAANEYDVAAAGKVTGVRGENFVSDVRVFNPSYFNRASVILEYFQAGNSPNATATNSLTVDIAPRGTAVLNDIAGAGGFNLAGTTGGLRVISATPVAVSSRIYDDQRGNNQGTFGQFIPGFARGALLRNGVLAHLQSNAEARTNLGFFNPNSSPVDVRLELRDSNGAVLGTATRVLLESLTQQLSSLASYFPGVDVSNRASLSVAFQASAPLIVGGSVVDATSSDPIFVVPAADPGSPVQ